MDKVQFWTRLEAEYGEIKPHVKAILEFQNLCSESLGKLTLDKISNIEKDMRDFAPNFLEQATAGGTPLENIYGTMFTKSPQDFRFLEGEKMCLLDLANIVNEKGIKSFLKTLPKSKKLAKVQEADDPHLKSLLLDKIQLHYSTLDDSFNPMSNLMNGIDVTLFKRDDGRIGAKILCPICRIDGKDATLTAQLSNTNSWSTYAFTRHVADVHGSEEQTSTRKRKSNSKKEELRSEINVTPTTEPIDKRNKVIPECMSADIAKDPLDLSPTNSTCSFYDPRPKGSLLVISGIEPSISSDTMNAHGSTADETDDNTAEYIYDDEEMVENLTSYQPSEQHSEKKKKSSQT